MSIKLYLSPKHICLFLCALCSLKAQCQHIDRPIYGSGGGIKTVSGKYLEASVGEVFDQTLTFQLVTGLPSILAPIKFENIKIYPSPAKDKITFIVNKAESRHFDVELLDLSGKTISSYKFNRGGPDMTASVDIDDLPAGWYIISVLGDNKKEMYKGRFLKQ